MTEPIETENKEKEKTYMEMFDEFLEDYQKHSGKVSIGLSVLGGVSAILAGKLIIAGSIAVGITNASLFFSGLMIEKIVNKKNIIENENKSLKNEMQKRMTLINNFQFPQDSQTNISPISPTTPVSTASTNTHYEEV